MSRSLGIFVSSDKHLSKIIEICRAAKKRDIGVSIFLTHLGVLLTKDPLFSELGDLADLSLCNVGFKGHGLTPPVQGISEKDFATQMRHGAIIKECDRYLVF